MHRGAGVFLPPHGKFARCDAHALGEDQKLGIEEPFIVLDERQQHVGRLGGYRLKSALRVVKMHAQIALQHAVVRTRDKLSFGAALHARCRQQTRAKTNVGTPVQNGADKLGNLSNIGGEVDIHIGAHAGLRRAPCDF